MKMKKIYYLLLFSCLFVFMVSCNNSKKEIFTVDSAKENLEFAIKQYEGMYSSIEDIATYPRNIQKNGETHFVNPEDWTSGFFPGSLWYLFEYSGEEELKEMAENSNAGLETLKTNTGTHDLGFMMYCSYGNGLRLTENSDYKDILVEGAYSLATRFDSIVGCIKSWDWQGPNNNWQYPVIVDNMMNLEFLFWAAKVSGDELFYKIATTHANTTMKNHFRDDYSSYHVVDYDTLTGEARWKGTHQGYADESAWARGQAWGLYGYTMCYRETKDPSYLEQAKNIANYILDHPNLPDDFVLYWDFFAPDIPNTERDASAAAVTASALLELQNYVEEPLKTKFFNSAEKILSSLSSPAYRAEENENNYFILKHSVGHKPGNSEIDTPLNYADYYYIEALKRYIDLSE